ncbi:hypothetical protein MNBD_GAMMA24-525 [hydrothermal vent metagenome]|uniref:Uncharacterized protein n=1 Tax=hydrothermal vent metagenome TaxID=652676 RepID=A0A3B1BNI3_9ZZZZ
MSSTTSHRHQAFVERFGDNYMFILKKKTWGVIRKPGETNSEQIGSALS